MNRIDKVIKKDPNTAVEVSKKAVTYSPTMWQYHLR